MPYKTIIYPQNLVRLSVAHAALKEMISYCTVLSTEAKSK